jgi:putative oxidoreductase
MRMKGREEISKVNVDKGFRAYNIANSLITILDRMDQKIVGFMSSYAILIIRISLGIVFVWFGLLKVVGVSPVFDLASHVVYWLPAELFVPLLGIWEIAIGVGLLLGKALRVILAMLFLQLAGTFLLLLIWPEAAFQGGNPLFLTTEGEFVIKNLVLIAAGVAVGGTVRYQFKERRRQQQRQRMTQREQEQTYSSSRQHK